MTLEISVRENCSGLTSDRATERKKCAESLKTFLSGNAAPSMLTANTLKTTGYTWDKVFNHINDYILKEAENYEKSKTYENTIKPLATSLLHMVVTGSTKGKAYIKCDKITSACLFILKSQRLTKAIGDAYLNLLYKYIITSEHYVGVITPQSWDELLDVCLATCASNHSKLDYYTKLRLVWLIMKNGSRTCQFVCSLRDALPRLQKQFLTPTTDKKVQEVLIDISLLLVETLSSECRLAMCKFTEATLGTLFKYYDPTMDKKKAILFKLLHKIVLLHHPQGRLRDEEGSLAYSWTSWNKHLNSITEIIHLEVKAMQKLLDAKFRIKETTSNPVDFFCLAAAVFYQVFNMPVQANENEEGNASKRQKMSLMQQRTFSDLVHELQQNHVPWLGIVTMYVKHFGDKISASEISSLLPVLDSYIASNNTNLNWAMFEELTCLVLEKYLSLRSSSSNVCDVLLLALWNSCVRNSTTGDVVHRAMHNILQRLLCCEIITFQNVQSLVKLYHERAMPVTDHSVGTLCHVLHAFFRKFNDTTEKLKCSTWFTQNDLSCTDMRIVQDLLLRLISNENINLEAIDKASKKEDSLYDILFKSLDKSVLFSEFELELTGTKPVTNPKPKNVEISNDIEDHITGDLELKLSEFTEKFKSKQLTLVDFAKFIKIVHCYLNVILKFTKVEVSRLKQTPFYESFKVSLKLLFTSLTEVLKRCEERPEDIELLNIVRSILWADCDRVISREVRTCMSKEFFISIHVVVCNNHPNQRRDVMEVEDLDENTDMRRSCIYLLAAYCKTDTNERSEIVDLILSPELYDFFNNGDIRCAFQCMSMLINPIVEGQSIDLVFKLIISMCKSLYRNPKATGDLLQILLLILEEVWASPQDTVKENCGIILSSCLSRCKQLFYPPNVAALIYECVAKIEQINQKQNHGSKYRESLIEGTKGDIHSLRLYCCYLVKMVADDYNADHVQLHITRSLELFSIDASGKDEQVLKDELANRTLTVLHSFFAVAQTKTALMNSFIKAILKVQKEKSLDKNLVKKVLNKMTNIISVPEISVHLKNNILALLHFWFLEKYTLDDLPIYLIGFSDLGTFIDSHMKWVAPAEIFWCKDGNIEQSEILQRVGTDVKSTVENCFSNIMILCLPYIVTQKYNLKYDHQENELAYTQSTRNAEKMFKSATKILGSKFSSLFAEKIGELVLLSASHLADYQQVKDIFGFDVPRSFESFYYPKEVFLAILKYLADVADHDIMQFLCEQQPMVISKIILKLWSNVVQKTILENKAQALHTFITFINCLKSDHSAEHFVCNFACHSLLHAIKNAKNAEETKLLLETLLILLQRFLPEKNDLLFDTLPLIVSLLKIKKEEGFDAECRSLLDMILSPDHVDSKILLSQREPKISSCTSGTEFRDSLKMYMAGLSCPSYEVVRNLKSFLKANRAFINSWCRALNLKGFSEDCKMSLLHKIINFLNNILTSTSDDKTKIEACNCLSELGTYDLKTLVMVAPADSRSVTDLKPAQYFAMVVLRHLAQLLTDEDPLVVSKVIATLSRLLIFREGKYAYDLTEYEQQQQILKQFITPNSNYGAAKFQINETKFDVYRRLDFWLPLESEDHSKWICRITCAILHVITSGDNYLSNLCVVCKSKPSLSRTVLPPLLGLLLSISNNNEVAAIAGQINKFFNFFWDKTFYSTCSENSENMSKKRNAIDHDHKLIIQDVLDVVNFVRLQRIHYPKRPDEIETYNFLKLDYDMVSWSAAICDHSLTAIYYGELWASSRNNSIPPSSPEETANLLGGENMQSILRKCFTSIGEMDAIEGCGSGHLTSEEEKRKHLINTGQYSDALLFHDIALSHETDTQDNFTLEYGVVRSLHKSGMHRLALQYIKSLPENDKLDDVKYDCLSFLGDWSVFVDTNEIDNKLKNPNTNMNSLLKELRYSCLKDSLNLQLETEEYEYKLVAPLNKAKLAVSKLCQKLNMDNCQSVYSVLSQLQIFNDVDDYNSVKSNKSTMRELLNKWQVEKLAPFQDFKHVEVLVSQRCLILDNAMKYYSTMQNDIVNLQLRYAELGLSNDRIPLSQRLLAMAKRGETTGEISLVEGQIAWAKGHKDIALSLLRNIINNETQDSKLTAIALRQYGTWMAESKCENARNIIDKYLQRSLQVLGLSDNAAIRLKVYYDLAKFADAEYKQVVAYIKSSIFENKVKIMEHMKNAVSSVRNTQTLSKDERKALMANQKLSNLDEAEIHSTIAEKKRFLDLAMKYYLLSLKKDEENNLSVFRIISLWLDNPEFEFEPGEGDSFENLLNAVPSRKYVPVLPQLAPRLSNIDDAFSHNLNQIIRRCSKDHPHHTLPILFGIKNSDKDKVILNASAGFGNGKGKSRGSNEEPRITAAAELIQELASTDDKLACIISQMDLMCDAIISFANYDLKSKEPKQTVPKAEPISKLSGLSDIPIPTITLTIRNDCNYSSFPAIVSFGNTIELVGGINHPKKMICKGSDGKDRTILIKGEDDLRQDAVMQQVFNIVNTLLGINPVTNRNKLLIRTYKVVPLSRRSGVLEWCEGTVPLGTYLVDIGSTPGAHRRYRPRDISCSAARAKLSDCHQRGKSNAERLSAFLKILKEFKPVFHYFFYEHFSDPITWYERRLAYTKSVATSSMVGYIMGLGDRHVQNILVDKKTAEVIHIDFGIAFDQGKALPTPETVPFRLTQDMIAGFGCSGVEGMFRRCCEKTMQLLRDNQEALLTILEVLLCDPLYSWCVTPAEAKRKQNIVSTDVTLNMTGAPAGGGSGLAERALLAVSSKLSGTEGGVAGGVAVPGQVARLLHSATNPANLSRLYPGWQPYL